MPLDIVRWGGLAGMVTGGVFVLSSALSLAIRGPYSFLDAVFVSAWLLALVTVAGIYGLLGRAGSLILPARIVGSTVGTAALVVGTASFAWLAFPGGALLMLVGFVLLGIATPRAGVLPRSRRGTHHRLTAHGGR